MQFNNSTFNATEMNFVDGTLNKWIDSNQKPSSSELDKLLAIVKEMQERLAQMQFNSKLQQEEAGQLLQDAEKNLKAETVDSDPKLVQTNLQKSTKLVIEAFQVELEKLNLEPSVQRKIRHSLDTAILELEKDKPEKRTVGESLKATSTILSGVKNVLSNLKELSPYIQLVSLWIGEAIESIGWRF